MDLCFRNLVFTSVIMGEGEWEYVVGGACGPFGLKCVGAENKHQFVATVQNIPAKLRYVESLNSLSHLYCLDIFASQQLIEEGI